MTATILPTANEPWGFFGTMRHHVDPLKAWNLALPKIMAATGCSDLGARDFLDSREGRHFADDVANGLYEGLDLAGAIDRAVERWMGWTVGRGTSRATGIPAGLPYLTGFAHHYEILAEAAA